MATAEGGTPPIGTLVVRFFLLVPMVKGFSAIRALKNAPPPSDPLPADVGSRGQPWDPPRKG
jgi:hypothetical protein